MTDELYSVVPERQPTPMKSDTTDAEPLWWYYAASWIVLDVMVTVVVLAKEILILTKGFLSR